MSRRIAPLQLPQEFQAFTQLEKISFGEAANESLPMHEWLLRDNPDQPVEDTMMYVMRDDEADGKLIAADGLVPQRLQVGGKTYLAAHSVKSMTHPDYKRQGIFTTMTQNSVAQAREHGVDLVIGLANAASYPAYVKFNFITAFEKTALLKPLHMTRRATQVLHCEPAGKVVDALFRLITTRWRRQKALQGYEVEHLDHVPETVQELWDRVGGMFDCLLVRDYQYLDYRYNQRPDAEYETIVLRRQGIIEGLTIVRVSGRTASVVELFCAPEDVKTMTALAEAATTLADTRGAEYLVASTGSFGQFEKALHKNGFVRRISVRNNMMIACLLNEEITAEAISGIERWHLTQGDGETELDL